MNNKIFTNETLPWDTNINIDNIVDVDSINSFEELVNLLLANGLTVEDGMVNFYAPITLLSKITHDGINSPEHLKLYSDFIIDTASKKNDDYCRLSLGDERIMICIQINRFDYRTVKVSLINYYRPSDSIYYKINTIWEEETTLPTLGGTFISIMSLLAEAQISKYFYIRNHIFAAFDKMIDNEINVAKEPPVCERSCYDNVIKDRSVALIKEFITVDYIDMFKQFDISGSNIEETLEYMMIHENEYIDKMLSIFENTMIMIRDTIAVEG